MTDNHDIERLAAAVHQAYLDTCARLGWAVKPANQVPYDELSEDSKELDRASVRAVLAGIGQNCPNCAALRERVAAWKRVATHMGECDFCRHRLLGPPDRHRHCMQLDALYTAAVDLDTTPTPEPPAPPANAAPPITIQRLERHMAILPFVQWDRYVQTAHHIAVYGWIPRADRRADFALIDLDDRGPMWWTSSAEYSAEIGRLLDGEGHHVDCKRVEHAGLDLPNVVRLKAPTDAAACPTCDDKQMVMVPTGNGEFDCDWCPTCQSYPKEGANGNA